MRGRNTETKKATKTAAFFAFYGDKGGRTPDLMTASHTLCQTELCPRIFKPYRL